MRNVLIFFSKLGYFRNNHYFVEPLLEKKTHKLKRAKKANTCVSTNN